MQPLNLGRPTGSAPGAQVSAQARARRGSGAEAEACAGGMGGFRSASLPHHFRITSAVTSAIVIRAILATLRPFAFVLVLKVSHRGHR